RLVQGSADGGVSVQVNSFPLRLASAAVRMKLLARAQFSAEGPLALSTPAGSAPSGRSRLTWTAAPAIKANPRLRIIASGRFLSTSRISFGLELPPHKFKERTENWRLLTSPPQVERAPLTGLSLA